MRWVSVMFLVSVVAAVAAAQPPANPQWQQFREQHKYHFQLQEMFYKIGELEKKGGQTALTKEQAKKLLDIFKPLTQKEKLTADEAKDALKRLKAVLRPDQLNALQRIQLPRWGGQQGNRPSGAGGPSGGGMRFDPSRLQNFNPLSVKVDEKSPAAEFQKRRAQRVKEVLSLLEKKAKG
ncbi:MAG: hypothetical protein HZLCBSQH_002143 [Candidatus Fervidibacterota bacterium]